MPRAGSQHDETISQSSAEKSANAELIEAQPMPWDGGSNVQAAEYNVGDAVEVRWVEVSDDGESSESTWQNENM